MTEHRCGPHSSGSPIERQGCDQAQQVNTGAVPVAPARVVASVEMTAPGRVMSCLGEGLGGSSAARAAEPHVDMMLGESPQGLLVVVLSGARPLLLPGVEAARSECDLGR